MKKLKIKLSKKIRLICSIILGTFLIAGIYQLRHSSIFCYEKDYFSRVGFGDLCSYEEVVCKKGEPLKIEKKEGWGSIVYYDGVEFGCSNVQDWIVEYIKVTGAQYRFGIWKVGVGTTRKKIESVYRHKIKWSTKDEIEVCEGETWINFEFNENNHVKAIYISIGWA